MYINLTTPRIDRQIHLRGGGQETEIAAKSLLWLKITNYSFALPSMYIISQCFLPNGLLFTSGGELWAEGAASDFRHQGQQRQQGLRQRGNF
jgi:hypothetical protein